jgi:hypothetical protein
VTRSDSGTTRTFRNVRCLAALPGKADIERIPAKGSTQARPISGIGLIPSSIILMHNHPGGDPTPSGVNDAETPF